MQYRCFSESDDTLSHKVKFSVSHLKVVETSDSNLEKQLTNATAPPTVDSLLNCQINFQISSYRPTAPLNTLRNILSSKVKL